MKQLDNNVAPHYNTQASPLPTGTICWGSIDVIGDNTIAPYCQG